jgi:8-oxo-dGTP diphosphatase
VVVVAAIIAREGRVLACQRNRSGKFPLKWEFPGGKVQSGETPRAALARELNEELGVTARVGQEIYRTRHKYAEMPGAVELIFFEARVEGGEIENRIFEQIGWVEPHKLRGMDFLEADREFVEKLANGKFAGVSLMQNAKS